VELGIRFVEVHLSKSTIKGFNKSDTYFNKSCTYLCSNGDSKLCLRNRSAGALQDIEEAFGSPAYRESQRLNRMHVRPTGPDGDPNRGATMPDSEAPRKICNYASSENLSSVRLRYEPQRGGFGPRQRSDLD